MAKSIYGLSRRELTSSHGMHVPVVVLQWPVIIQWPVVVLLWPVVVRWLVVLQWLVVKPIR